MISNSTSQKRRGFANLRANTDRRLGEDLISPHIRPERNVTGLVGTGPAASVRLASHRRHLDERRQLPCDQIYASLLARHDDSGPSASPESVARELKRQDLALTEAARREKTVYPKETSGGVTKRYV